MTSRWALTVSIACALLVGWAAYVIAAVARSPLVNRLVVAVVVASMFSGGLAVVAGFRGGHEAAIRRWRP